MPQPAAVVAHAEAAGDGRPRHPRRLVGEGGEVGVDVEGVEEVEERLVAVGGHPVDARAHQRPAPPLLDPIAVEAAREAELGVEPGAVVDQAGGEEAGATEALGEHGDAGVDGVLEPHRAVDDRRLAGEQAGVRRLGPARRGVVAGEHLAVGGQAIEGRRRQLATEGAHEVGAQGVDGDQQHLRRAPRAFRGRRRRLPVGEHQVAQQEAAAPLGQMGDEADATDATGQR